MEYANAGSLGIFLSEPEQHYGVQDEDFVGILHDIGKPDYGCFEQHLFR